MCFPALPLVLAAAGTALNFAGNQRAQKAQTNARTMERGRQQQLERQQEASLGQSEAAARRLRDPNAQNEAVDARRQAFIAALDRGPASQGILPGSDRAPTVVSQVAGEADGARRAYGEQQASALANLTAMGDQLLGTQIDMGRAGQDIAQAGASRRRSAAVLDAELQAAAQKGSTLRGLGGLLQMAGQAAGASAGNPMGGGGRLAPLKRFQDIY